MGVVYLLDNHRLDSFRIFFVLFGILFLLFYSARHSIAIILMEQDDRNRGKLWCPTYMVGTQCPDHSFISYYKCCGSLHKECCSHLRIWVVILIIGLPILLLIPPVAYLLRRLLCRRSSSAPGLVGYSAGIQMIDQPSTVTRANMSKEASGESNNDRVQRS